MTEQQLNNKIGVLLTKAELLIVCLTHGQHSQVLDLENRFEELFGRWVELSCDDQRKSYEVHSLCEILEATDYIESLEKLQKGTEND